MKAVGSLIVATAISVREVLVRTTQKRHGADIPVDAAGSNYATFATLPSVGTVEIVFSTCEAIW